MLMSDPWLSIYLIVTLSCPVVMIVSLFILRVTLDRRVRKALPPDKVYDSPLDWYFGFMRSMGFAYAAVMERANRYAIMDYYNGFNVKGFANRFEKSVSLVFVTSVFVFMLSVVFFLVTDFFNLIEWHYSD